jgi:branched-chain amino acid transport system substrate-binding protein
MRKEVLDMNVRVKGKRTKVIFFCMMFACTLMFGSIAQSADSIKIGVVLCITGYGGALGTPEKEAIQVEMEKINSKGGLLGKQIEIYFEDDQSNPTNSAVATTKLIRDKSVCAVIGSSLTNNCMAMLPIFEREGVVNVSLGAGREITQPLRKWVFRIPATDTKLSPILLSFAVKRLGAQKIALFHGTDASGMMGAQGIIENVEKYNAKIIITEKFDPKDTNMTPQLAKIKAARPDVIILYGTSAPASVIAKNYQQLELEKIPVIGSHGIPTRDFIKIAGEAVEGGRWIFLGLRGYVAEKLQPDDPYRKNVHDPFLEGLKKKYGGDKKYNVFHGNGFDGFHAVIAGLRVAGTDNRVALRDAMEKASFPGFQGEFNYTPTDHDGQDTEKNRIPVIIKGGEFWPYK